MQTKRNEISFGKMMRSFGYYVHKWGDVRYCPHCHTPLPKAEKKPDFLVAVTYAFVECKGAESSWHFDGDFRPNQIEFMDANIEKSWIFVEIGPGNAPSGKVAFLMKWSDWKGLSGTLLENGYKSMIFERTDRSRVPTVAECIAPCFMLVWEKGKWTIPQTHYWTKHYPEKDTINVVENSEEI